MVEGNTVTLEDFYDNYDEDTRLKKSNFTKLEHETTMMAFFAMFPLEQAEHTNVLEIGAGTGVISCELCQLGYNVVAVEYVQKQVEVIQSKIEAEGLKMRAVQGDARHLAAIETEAFDCVLCLGPLYHLQQRDDRARCASEIARTLKHDGVCLAAFINRSFIYPYVVSRLGVNAKILNDFSLQGFSTSTDDVVRFFYASTLEEMHGLFADEFDIIEALGLDGSFEMKSLVNSMEAEEFEKWKAFHFENCKTRSAIESANHSLLVVKAK